MKGATALPPPITSRTPIKRRTTMMGMSHHFLRSLINSQRSFKKSMCMCLLCKGSVFVNPDRIVASNRLFQPIRVGRIWQINNPLRPDNPFLCASDICRRLPVCSQLALL